MDSDEEKALHLSALQNAASMVAALRRAEAERDQARADAEAARADLEALNQVGIALAGELDLERIVQTVTDAATKLTGAQLGTFFYNVVDNEGEKLTLYTLSGAPRPGHLPVHSYLRVPVTSRTGDVIGGLLFEHSDIGVFDERAERVASGIAGRRMPWITPTCTRPSEGRVARRR